ncbi:Hybrid signal transduction histidine kinase K [Hondaea fermentalgiana]|uniref:histidine kinase n=1 Tax=Hondaea fermentalgiana TaxID=2315210 RepID=A0A2R5G0W1_9STRA|nr:Hybrid signal transduction histidine kinase K [Hondaea fermentalgiana]|eukprot:GBG24657.1 Hybrid signal transduction histidine kinase K [Hondaea fermentalgiana]
MGEDAVVQVCEALFADVKGLGLAVVRPNKTLSGAAATDNAASPLHPEADLSGSDICRSTSDSTSSSTSTSASMTLSSVETSSEASLLPHRLSPLGKGTLVFANQAFRERFQGSVNADAAVIDIDDICAAEPDTIVREKVFLDKTYLVLESETAQVAAHRASVEVAQKQLQFVAQASHEIRTPLAGLLGMIECLDDDIASGPATANSNSPTSPRNCCSSCASTSPSNTVSAKLRRPGSKRDVANAAIAAGTSDVLRQCANTLHAVVNDVLDLTACSSNQVLLRPSPINIKGDCIDRVIGLFDRIATQQESEIVCEPLDDNFPNFVLVDEHRLNQVVSNLVGNAVKYTQSGRIVIRASLVQGSDAENDTLDSKLDDSQGQQNSDASQHRIAIEVEDTGMGISEADQMRIFEPFYQAKDTPRATIKAKKRVPTAVSGNKASSGDGRHRDAPLSSSGLGLAISRDLARVMGGDVIVNSTLGQGSTFRFEFAFAEPSQEEIRASLASTSIPSTSRSTSGRARCPSSRKSDAKSGSTPVDLVSGAQSDATRDPAVKVLVVDDNLVNCQVCARLLKRLNVTCDVAHDGLEAVKMYEKNHYALIFMDCHMPNLDGFEATRRILSSAAGSDAKDPVIVAMTASVMARDQAKCFDAGMHELLPKPFTMDSLQRIIDRLHGTVSC